jgi:plasmid maintenance system antidote protein VapI
MNLRDYLHFERMTQAEFAKKIHYTEQYISAHVNRRINVTKKFAQAVVTATNGKVTMDEVMSQNMPKQEKN